MNAYAGEKCRHLMKFFVGKWYTLSQGHRKKSPLTQLNRNQDSFTPYIYRGVYEKNFCRQCIFIHPKKRCLYFLHLGEFLMEKRRVHLKYISKKQIHNNASYILTLIYYHTTMKNGHYPQMVYKRFFQTHTIHFLDLVFTLRFDL